MADISFRLLRSSTEAKRPTAAQIADGELALNTDNGTGGIFFEDTSGNVVKVGPAELGGSAPNSTPAGSAGNSAGEFWVDTSNGNHILKVYNGTSWVAVEGVAASAASATEVLFTGANGALTGDSNFTYDSATEVLGVTEVEGRLDGPVVFQAKSGEALSEGDVVYVSGVSGNFPVVSKAQANSSSTMPAMGVSKDSATGADEDVTVVTLGTLSNFDTSTPGWSVNDTLYVSATTAGAFTDTAPTGESNLLQNIGKVMRVSGSVGRIKIGGAGRTNATPNLDDGKIFIGNGSNQAVSSTLTDALSAQAGISSSADAVAITIDSSERVGLTGELTVSGNVNANGNIVGDGLTNISGINVVSTNYLTIDNINVNATSTELNYLDGSTPGTATASNALVLDASKDITGINSLNSTSLSVGTTGSPFQASATNDVVTKSYADATYASGTGISSTATSTVVTLTDLTATFDTDIVQTPSVSLSPANNGELIVEATSNTSLTFKLKGSDGVVRSAVLTLS